MRPARRFSSSSSRRRPARPFVKKLIESAVANARTQSPGVDARHALRRDGLRRQGAEQVHMRRWRPRAMGRATRIQKGVSATSLIEPRRALGVRTIHGTESPSVWLPPRRHQDVELASGTRTSSYAKWLHEDIRIKRAVKDYLYNANIASVEIERAANKAKVIVYTARPGMVIGKGGKGIEILKIGNLEDRRQGRDARSPASSRSPRTRSSSTSRRSARPRPTRSSSPRTSRRSSSAASPSAAR